MNNKQFSERDQTFRTCCELAGILPTRRQASKWFRKTGAAYAAFTNGKYKEHLRRLEEEKASK